MRTSCSINHDLADALTCIVAPLIICGSFYLGHTRIRYYHFFDY